jgi:dTDP-4-amino-4,6-dideoxygalactose transaminase
MPYIFRHDLVPQYERFRDAIDAALHRVLLSGKYILSSELGAFEQEFAAYVGCEYGIGVASGTDALALALRASGIQQGDEVITSTYAPTPTPAAIIQAGGIPVFVDAEPNTCLMDPDAIEDKITARTRFIMPVHIFGIPCDMERIRNIAEQNGLIVIEDAAQAHGSTLNGRKAGSFGDFACFSFYPTKNLGGYGDGGMVMTNVPKFADALRLFRNYGKKDHPLNSEAIGVNSRLDEMQAAILRVKLPYLDSLNRERAERVSRYREGLVGLPIYFLDIAKQAECNHHILTVLCRDRRDALSDFLKTQGIQTNIYYPMPLHRMPAYRDFVPKHHEFSVAEALCEKALALPLYSELSFETIDYVIEKISEFFGN